MKKEVVDIRYYAKILFLVLTASNLGATFGVLWLVLPFTLYLSVILFVNGSSRKEFSRRPKYNKIPAYGAIVPLALYWVMTPGVENGVNPTLVFLPGLYFLFLAILQERSRGNGGYESFVAFDGLAALLISMYSAPRGGIIVGIVALLLAVFAYSRRGTAWYKYILFLLVIAMLGASSYGGWRYWRSHRYENGARWAEDYYQRERVMGFDQVAALGSFGSNYSGKYNSQVVLRVWDAKPSRYLKAASYEKYVAGIWKLPTKPLKTLMPAYYQVDYAVMEVADSLTRPLDSADVVRNPRQIWVQSTINNFGFVFAPYGAVGFAAKDVDSLLYFAGGMVNGLDKNGKRSDWHYFVCDNGSAPVGENASVPVNKNDQVNPCIIPDSLQTFSDNDLLVGKRYEPLMDSVVDAMGLVRRDVFIKDSNIIDSSDTVYRSDSENLQRILAYFKDHFTYSLQVPGLERFRGSGSDVKRDPLSVFWHAKQGFCEYYATLATLTLRRVGIPARYVTGFANPEVVEGRPYAVFRRKHSHSWVEAFVDGRWVVFDPTPPMLTPMGSEPSWLSAKWESLQGRAARLMHFLKEGEWRRTVDAWQNYTQKITDGIAIYVALVIAILAFVGLKVRGYLKGRRRDIITPKNAAAAELARKLTKAELVLTTLGYHREDGETVGAFIKRLQRADAGTLGTKKADPSANEKLQQTIKILQDYEEHRWMK